MIDEVIESKKLAALRKNYVRHLEFCLKGFARGREEMPIDEFNKATIEQWLTVRKYRPAMRKSALSRISTLFSYAVAQDYIPSNPCKKIQRPTIEQVAPTILTVERARHALNWTRANEPRFLGWLVLALLAGLRPEEADKIHPSDISVNRGTVRVDAKSSKVRQRRIVHLKPSALTWLKAALSESWLPLAQATRRRYVRRLRATLGFDAWPKDVLRHSAASYWLAEDQDAGMVAAELGNSVGVLLKHYKELVYREQASEFWAIKPN